MTYSLIFLILIPIFGLNFIVSFIGNIILLIFLIPILILLVGFLIKFLSSSIGIKKDGSPEDSLWGLAWTTKDIKKAHKRLLDAGVSITDVKDGRKPNTLVATIKSHTSNIPTLLIQHL